MTEDFKSTRRDLFLTGGTITTAAVLGGSFAAPSVAEASGRSPRHRAAGPHHARLVRTQLSEQAIASNLQTIYSTPGLSDYGCYFTLLNLRADRFISVVGEAQQTPGVDYDWQPYKHVTPTPDKVILRVRFMDNLIATQAFKAPSQFIDYTTFVNIMKYGYVVPYQTAMLIDSSFLAGLVTRLIFQKYYSACHALVPNGLLSINTAPPVAGSPPVRSAEKWIGEYFQTLSNTMTGTGSWNSEYLTCLTANTDSALQVAGMVEGWRLGDKLTDGTIDTSKGCLASIWALLGSRYTTEHIGRLVGYTLFLLGGYLNNERIIDYRGGTTYAQILDPTAIFNKFGPHLEAISKLGGTGPDFTFRLANQFYGFVLSDFQMLMADSPGNQTAIAAYRSFLDGYEAGLTCGATTMFRVMYTAGWETGYDSGYVTGFTTGYAIGFSNGYGEGYANGWQAGYNTGYTDGQNSWTGILGGIANTIGTAIGDAQAIAGVASQIVGAGSVVAGLFA